MIGITSYGAYIPRLRLSRAAIVQNMGWFAPAIMAVAQGERAMCNWERFCTFAREPERRKVGIDARVLVEGVAYTVDPNLAGETVVLW